MSKTKLLILPMCLLMFSACSQVSRKSPVTLPAFDDMQEAAFQVAPVGVADKWIVVDINESKSPQIIYNNTESFYEVVDVKGIKGNTFEIIVSAMCDCLGIRKWKVEPIVVLFDPLRNPIQPTEPGKVDRKVVSGTFEHTGTYKLLVVASAEHLGQEISSVQSYIYPNQYVKFAPIPISLPRTVHESGEVGIEIIVNKE